MAELNRTFHEGKQNRDFDDRLVPRGQYRRAQNARVARSEGANVGALENVLGNTSVSSFVDDSAVVIGSIRDQQLDRIFYFIAGRSVDGIFEYNERTDSTRPILRSKSRTGVLKFNVNNLITGVNLIGEDEDRLLYWTDGLNPPRKINIQRIFDRYLGRIDGVVDDETGMRIHDPITEAEISVVKAPPLSPPSISSETSITRAEEVGNNEDQLAEENLKEKFIRFAYRWKYVDNEYSAFSPFSDIPFNAGRFKLDRQTGAITSMENLIRSVAISVNTGPVDVVEVELLYIDTSSSVVWVVESFNKANEGWRDSVDLSPNHPVEKPINFSTNKLYRPLPQRELNRVYDDVPRIARAQDIIENRIVYGDFTNRYDLEDIRKEFVRDNEGNIVQDATVEIREEIVVDFTARLADNENAISAIHAGLSGDTDTMTNQGIIKESTKNLKSDRDYELAIVYGDPVGRRTPALTSRNNVVNVPLNRANRVNRIEVDIASKAPEWATWYRFYVKNSKNTHFNVIPLETIADPFDPERFVWFRLSEADVDKVSVGDFLVIKVSDNQYYTEKFDQKTQVRVEEIGVQQTNFLETTTPRVDPDDENSEIITRQRAGLWMKIRNTDDFIEDIVNEDDNSFATESLARTNNTRRFDDYRPIRGTMEDYIDTTNYYPANDSLDDAGDNDDVLFGGTYNPAAGGNDQDGTAVIGGTGSGPMRIELEITDPNSTGKGTHFTYNYFINPTPAQGGTGNDKGKYIEVRRITTDIAMGTGTALVNGATVSFNSGVDYFVGDKFTVVYRKASNFLWSYLEDSFGNPNPNDSSKKGIGGRRANILMPVNPNHAEDESIYGNSIIQFGVEDGLNTGKGGSPLSGDAISLPFDENTFTTSPNYYPNIEEWMFESGFWNPTGSPLGKIEGANSEGDPIGMSQFGFWRGVPTLPHSGAATAEAALIAAGVTGLVGTTAGTAAASALATLVAQAGVAGVSLGPVGLGIAAAAIVTAGVIAIVGSFTNRPGEGDQWRLISSGGMIQLFYDEDGNKRVPALGGDKYFDQFGNEIQSTDYDTSTEQMVEVATNQSFPLYMIVQSGAYNHSRNKNAKDIRMKSSWSYVQGTIDAELTSSAAQVIFETVPTESVLDDQVFYETYGETYACLNGIHFGPGNQASQLITFEDRDGNTFQSGNNSSFEAFTETADVTTLRGVPVDYWNCIAFDNGVESMVIGDQVGKAEINKGVKASTVIDEYGEVRNFSSLIYSGPFIDQTGLNRLNEFSAHDVGNRTIIKDLDEAYGPIRKVYAENTDLIVFQESKVNQVQVDKNALFNADNSTNIASSANFLNQTIPFVGEYGISDNPESFAVYGTQKFWTDKHRGVVLSLTGNQIVEISEQGMKDYFRDNLALYDVLIGSYDDYHDQYILTMRDKFNDPSRIDFTVPVLISKQGFLSRSEACRFPENKLQFQQVYEFFEDTTPGMILQGETLYTDVERGSPFNGDNDWFVAFEREDIVVENSNVRLLADTGEFVLQFTYQGDGNLNNIITPGQPAMIRGISGNEYNVTIQQVSAQGFHAIFAGLLMTDGTVANQSWDLQIDFKFVVNVDNFGNVRRKLDCLTIPPLNHDAFRASLYGYSSAAEACANGLVGQILYHNGNDATPDEGDYIYDSPFGNDEYVEVYLSWLDDFPYNMGDKVVFGELTYEAQQEVPAGIQPGTDTAFWVATDDPVQYQQGRTLKRGWYQIFDGSDFEDYVIRILQGEVVEKLPCAAIEAGRSLVMIGSRFERQATDTDEIFAARVCRNQPVFNAFHTGDAIVPGVGDILYADNFTDARLIAGAYSISGGAYVIVNSDGRITRFVPCFTRVCIADLLTTYRGVVDAEGVAVTDQRLFTDQINTNGQFTFLGVVDEDIYGTLERQSIPGVTIRWTARGSRRYPENETDFYELNLPDGLNPNDVVTLTNGEFVDESLGETNLEYTILEVCYNRTLVPQNVEEDYYAPDNTVLPDNSYPSADPAIAVARIFDLTGNIGTGTVEVSAPIFFDRTSIGRRQYFIDDSLATPLEGTNGITDTNLLDSVVIDGVTRYGLWWAFGPVINQAATLALLIDVNGFVLDSRTRELPFDLLLSFSDNALGACTELDEEQFIGDNDDFRDATTFAHLDESVPEVGFYSWLDHNDTPETTDDQRIYRYWDGNAFDEATAPTDNCPISLPAYSVRYTTNEQTAVCGQGAFRTIYAEGAAESSPGVLGPDPDVSLWNGPFGVFSPEGALPAGYINSGGNVLVWNGSSLATTSVACIQVCSDVCASNNGANGDCIYPSYCGDPAAT